eukprot:3941125-Rhodomonas_salina.1
MRRTVPDVVCRAVGQYRTWCGRIAGLVPWDCYGLKRAGGAVRRRPLYNVTGLSASPGSTIRLLSTALRVAPYTSSYRTSHSKRVANKRTASYARSVPDVAQQVHSTIHYVRTDIAEHVR